MRWRWDRGPRWNVRVRRAHRETERLRPALDAHPEPGSTEREAFVDAAMRECVLRYDRVLERLADS